MGFGKPPWRRGRVVAAVLVLMVAGVLHGLPAPQVRVQWADGVSASVKLRLEARLALREHSHEGASYLCDLLNPSVASLRSLVRAPEVRDTDGINRGVFELREPVRYGERRTGLAWRWGLERWVPAIAGLGLWLLLWEGWRWSGLGPHLVGVVRRTASVLWQAGRVAQGRAIRHGSAFLLRGIPVMDARAFGIFRVAFALMLCVLLVMDWDQEVPLDRQRELAFPLMEWIRPWVARPGGVETLEWMIGAGLLLFGAGLWTRVIYPLLVVALELWFFVFALRAGTHPLGLLPLALPVLLLVPWHEGVGLLRRPVSATPSRVPYGYAPWVLGMALGVAFVAAGYVKGLHWALNGTVRYHFMAEAEIALLPWGLWIAARPWLSVCAASIVVLVEHFAIVALFWRAWPRLAMGLVVIGLIAGFSVFHLAIWPAWWVLLLGFMPWEWLSGSDDHALATTRGVAYLPVSCAIAVGLLIVQQFVTSAVHIEAGP